MNVAKKIQVLCPLCGANNSRAIFCNNEITIARCRSCCFMYQSPRNIQSLEEEACKKESYYDSYLTTAGARKKIASDKFNRYLASHPKGKVLDIGCGMGEFLEVSLEKGWEAVGIDVSGWACRFLAERGFQNILQGTLEDAHFDDEEFDAVYLSHVLEHIPEPGPFLHEIRRVLKPGGLVLIEVPNEENFRLLYAVMNLLRGRKAKKIGPHPAHLNLFSRKTLGKFLSRAKLQPMVLRTEGLTAPGRVESMVQSPTPGVRIAVMLSYLRVDLLFGLGRYLVAVARKK